MVAHLYIDAFETIKSSTVDGVQGVIHISSGKQGPTVGFTLCTHGNEPCGLAVVKEFLSNDVQLLKGDVYLVLNNIKAAENYFDSHGDDSRKYARFIDINMNRLPKDLTHPEYQNFYEVSRAKELLPLWKKFDYLIDIHSITQSAEPMIIEGHKVNNNVVRTMPVPTVIRNLAGMLCAEPTINFTKPDCISFVLEAGNHYEEVSYHTTIDCVHALLHHLKMMELKHIPQKPTEHEIYVGNKPIFFPNESYRLTRIFPTYEKVQANEVIAIGNSKDVKAPDYETYSIMAPDGLVPTHFTEEILFLCTKEELN